MSQYPKLAGYVSEIDQFLQEFDKEHPKLTASQKKEQVKYQRIYALRDGTERPGTIQTLWEGF